MMKEPTIGPLPSLEEGTYEPQGPEIKIKRASKGKGGRKKVAAEKAPAEAALTGEKLEPVIEERPAEKPEAPPEAPKETAEAEKKPYTKEEWLEAVEMLKEQAAVEREKTKIEEKEEILELNEEATVKEPEKTAAEKPAGPEKPETKILDLYKGIREARKELAGTVVTLEKGKIKDYEKLPFYKNIKGDYQDLQRQLTQRYLEKAAKRWGADSEEFEKFRDKLIFKGAMGKEYERFQKDKIEALQPSKEKGRVRKLFEGVVKQYAKLPKPVRWGIAAGVGTAIAFGTGGVAAPALLGYAGFRYGRAALGALTAAGAKAVGDIAEKIWLKKYGKEAREEKITTELRKEVADVSDYESMSAVLMQKNDERNKELAQLAKRQKQWRVGKAVAMIGAGAGVAFWAGSIDQFSGSPNVSAGVKEQLLEPHGTPQVAEVIPPGTLHPENFIETAHVGDSVWRMAERQLESMGYFKGLTGTAEEIASKKTYLIDWVKDRVAEHPGQFGLTDPDKIAIGQKLDFYGIFKNHEAMARLAENVEKLPADQLKHVAYNNELISQWVHNHPEEHLTSGKVAEILGGKRLEALTEGDSTFNAENYLKGLAQEDREIAEARMTESFEDYQKLPGLTEEDMRQMQEFYGQKAGTEEELWRTQARQAQERLMQQRAEVVLEMKAGGGGGLQETGTGEELLGGGNEAELLERARAQEEALNAFYGNQVKLHNNILEVLAPSNLNPAEYIAIKNISVGKFLEETAGGWEKWRSPDAISIDLPHDGLYGASEYGRQLKLAAFIRDNYPTSDERFLSIEEYLRKFIKK